ncbi:hypothetical protein C8J56DRAFT_930332 [Mycena floridula]|nr:hypothetical protein C8J56DRAFT_930332 [Mycena floridula]
MNSPTAASFDALPNELIARVFRAGISEWPSQLALYCQVSRLWRDISFDTPDLWTQLRVPFRTIDVVVWTNKWLLRSKACPFDVHLELPNPFDDRVQTVLALLLNHSERLRRLAIHGDGAVYNSRQTLAPLRLMSPTSRLVHLEICFTGPILPLEIHLDLPFALQSPALESLMLCGTGWSTLPPNLTSLHIDGLVTDDDFLRLLVETSPSLRRLVLRRAVSNMVIRDHRSPSIIEIEMPSLCSLAISIAPSHPGLYCGILSYLSTPNLEFLELYGNFLKQSFFQRPEKLAKLYTLRLVEFDFQGHRDAPMLEPATLHALSTIKRLEVIHTPTQPLIPLGKSGNLSRRRSANFIFLNRPPLPLPWPMDKWSRLEPESSHSNSLTAQKPASMMSGRLFKS